MLYVARDRKRPERHDLGSILCLQVVGLLPHDVVQVQECTPSNMNLPSWLIGTPTLVVDDDGVLLGHQALTYLQELAVKLASTHKKPYTSSHVPPSQRRQLQMHPQTHPQTQPQSQSQPQSQYAPPSPDSPHSTDDRMWGTCIDGEEDDPLGGQKITSDDLAKATAARTQSLPPPPSSSAPKAPEPLSD